MLHRIWNKDGKHQDIQHFDLDAWIADGWLTSEPKPIEIADVPKIIAQKGKATKSAHVDPE